MESGPFCGIASGELYSKQSRYYDVTSTSSQPLKTENCNSLTPEHFLQCSGSVSDGVKIGEELL